MYKYCYILRFKTSKAIAVCFWHELTWTHEEICAVYGLDEKEVEYMTIATIGTGLTYIPASTGVPQQMELLPPEMGNANLDRVRSKKR